MWKQSFLMLLVLTVLTGGIYPLVVSLGAETLLSAKANGSLRRCQDQLVGSKLIAQKFASPKFFWPRPSAADHNPLNSTGSNLSPSSAALKKAYDERRKALMEAHPEEGEPPQDLLFASASGLDPEISPEAAKYQLGRIAKARNFTSEEKFKLAQTIDHETDLPSLGFIGEARVNVLELNLILSGCR